MKYFFGFLAAVALIVLVFILVLRGLGGGGGGRGEVDAQLSDYSKTETVMRLQINGPINAEQTHRYLTITAGRGQNVIDIYQGYGNDKISSQTFAATEDSYYAFLRALQLQGYTKGNTDPDRSNYIGVCPTGKTYLFEIVTGSGTVQRYWSSSCGGGTFDGNSAMVRQLFRAQIPDYSEITSGTGLQ